MYIQIEDKYREYYIGIGETDIFIRKDNAMGINSYIVLFDSAEDAAAAMANIRVALRDGLRECVIAAKAKDIYKRYGTL